MMFPHLVLGNYRYLDVFGNVQPARKIFTDAEIASYLRIDPDFDPQAESAPNSPQHLTDDNREYWEKAAAKGGHTLDDLLAE